jgi:hypothetical protein
MFSLIAFSEKEVNNSMERDNVKTWTTFTARFMLVVIHTFDLPLITGF